jgi:ATP-dependent Clp protease ATP-binding subunit ClpC
MFAARLEVSEAASEAIEREHLLLGLLEAQGGVAAHLMESVGLRAENVRPRVLSRAGTPLPSQVEVPFDPAATRALELAVAEADAMSCKEVTTGHLLLGLLRAEPSRVSILLREAGLELDAVRPTVQVQAAEGSEAKAPALEELFEQRIGQLGLL